MATVTDGTAFFVLGVIGTWLFAAVDAVRTAQLIRAGFAPDAEQDAISRRLYGNPLAWAVTMISLGTVFLLHTLFNVQLPVREFLPVVLVLLGGYMLFDFTARYRYKWLEAFLSIENLTNTEYREAQFFFTSRLAGEPASGVPDIHYTPGNPRSVLGGLAVRF